MGKKTLFRFLSWIPIFGFLITTYSMAEGVNFWKNDSTPIFLDFIHILSAMVLVLYI